MHALKLNKFLLLKNLLTDLNWLHDYATRSYSTFRLPNVKSARDKIHFLFQSVLYWNQLPQATFIKKVQSSLIQTYN